MVFFICQVCQASMKGAKVPQHTNSCRGARLFDCIDCGKTFTAESVAMHTQCMTEVEKYERRPPKSQKAATAASAESSSSAAPAKAGAKAAPSPKQQKKNKFSWRKSIRRWVRSAPNATMDIAALKEKVLESYRSAGGKEESGEAEEMAFLRKLIKAHAQVTLPQ